MVTPEKVLFQKGYGHADLESKRPFSPNTLLNIGSISKTVIGVALVQLVEEGKLSWDTDINTILPFPVRNPRFPDAPITVKHLATHSSGIEDTKAYGNGCYVLVEPMPKDLTAIPKSDRKELKAIRNNKMRPTADFLQDYLVPGRDHFKKKNFNAYSPGSRYAYTNIGAALAALVVEKVNGQEYRSYTTEQIFKPLGMTSTGRRFEDIDMDKHTTSYYRNGVPVPKYTLITYADGGVLSSCEDLATYLQQMMRAHFKTSYFLSPNASKTLLEVQFEDEEEGERSGTFWEINSKDKIGHNGGNPGIFTYIQFDPKTKVGLVFVTNTSAYQDPVAINGFKKIWLTMLNHSQKASIH